ncbi:solute carrier family 46 member 3-like isoform X2 [Galleria mellonella]|uniref:Solute carrier family 46 member 3-like isoform X2 n=1 Tax=Galleria mellonella TaxID=7137 RepID=A0ABM3MK28_GALME|nr:solute carrier family 46 member 3-like isoform X2 [Galleria mellonella]
MEPANRESYIENKIIDEETTEEQPFRQNEETVEKNQRTCCETLSLVYNNITVEPSVVLFVIPYILMTLTSQNLGLEKACRVNLNFGDEICTALKQQTVESQNSYEKEVQKLVTSAYAWKTYITATLPCLLGIFVGSFSDRTGHRKCFLLMPIVGQILASISSVLNVYFLDKTNLETYVLTEAVIEALSGGMSVFFITIFAYISAITTNETRTFRMGMVNFALTAGAPVGMALNGVVLKYLGYYGVYALVGGLNLLNLLYNMFVLKDPKRSTEQKKHDHQGVGYFLRTFFDSSNIKETIRVVFEKGPNKRRLRVCALLIVVSILFGPMFGEIAIMYMSTRYRFNWDEVKFSIFQTYNFVTHTIGTLFSITVFSKQLKWDDSILGIISTVSKIAGSFVYCFAPNERIFYIAPLVEILNGTSLLALRSIISKTVAPNELGKVNSVFGLTENIMPLVYVPLYTKVYTSTMEVLPGAVFLMSAALTFPAVCVFSWLLYEHRKGVKKSKKEKRTSMLNSMET